MSRLGLAGVGEDDVTVIRFTNVSEKNAWRDPPVLLKETKCQPALRQ